MYINPNKAIDGGWIKFPDWMNEQQREKCVQPAAIDITADRIFKIKHLSIASLSETTKVMRTLTEIYPKEDGYWKLLPGEVYDVMSDFFISVPSDAVAEFKTRSTLVRSGLLFVTGLFDPKFEGPCGGILHNFCGDFLLEPHTRIAQVAFIQASSAKDYAGGYNTKAGQHWTDTQ